MKTLQHVGIFLGLLGLIAFPAAAASAAAGTAWKAGAAAVNITPDGPVWLVGYGFRTKPSEGVDHPIFAKALALEDDQGGRVVFVTLDLINVPLAIREAVVRQAGEKFQLPPEAIVMNASHTHSAPAPYTRGVSDPVYAQKGVEYGLFVTEKIIQVMGEALSRAAPATLHYSFARAGFAMNRRLPVGSEIRNTPNPRGPVDHDVPVLRVSAADGSLKALLFGYACHNTTANFQTISGDYAGFAQAYLQEAHPGAVALFMLGAGGDQNPYPRHLSIEQARQHGRALANAVETALLVTNLAPVQGPLRSAFGFAQLDYADISRPDLERRARARNAAEKARAEALLKQLDSGQGIPSSYPCPVQVVTFGTDLTLIAIGGETTVEYSLRLKRELAGRPGGLWVAGYSNDGFGYLGSRKVNLEGGYEGYSANIGRHPGPWAPTTEDRVIARAYELLQSINH